MELKVTYLPGSEVRHFEKGTTLMDVVIELDNSLRKKALCVLVNGQVKDLTQILVEDAEIEICTFEHPEGKHAYRHTCSHIMAQAVKRLYPETKIAIGPAIADGFYYDFDPVKPFTPEHLEAICEEMEKIIRENISLERFELPRDEAIAFFKDLKEDYKVELIEDLPVDAAISLYRQGEFVDLCAGPHVPSTGYIKAFKLMSIAGAYWRGSEKNKMLQRIYAVTFWTKPDLQAYLKRLEEAKKRDHRKLGQELKLFTIMEEGPGFPFFFPKGMVLRNALQDYWRQLHQQWGYDEIATPVILNRQLWERSGHWSHYKENMYTTVIDEEDYAIKPMNCPGALLVYNSEMHSYRDLPIRLAEMGLVHRHELSGALHGLMRVRCFTQDDSHIFMLPEHITDEIKGVIKLIDTVYKQFGFNYHVELSTMPEDHMGDESSWEMATDALKKALEEMELPFTINPGDGAFYGPKIDFHLEDSIGRTWQCGTIQLDFQLPERFDLTYIGEDGQKHRPVMIHRVAFGSIERFIAILTEHYAGAFPAWLSPVQVKVLPITERQHQYAQYLANDLKEAGIRVEVDPRSEKIGYKIREAQLEKVPYMLILGDKEQEQGAVALRARGKGDLGLSNYLTFKRELLEEIKDRRSE